MEFAWFCEEWPREQIGQNVISSETLSTYKPCPCASRVPVLQETMKPPSRFFSRSCRICLLEGSSEDDPLIRHGLSRVFSRDGIDMYWPDRPEEFPEVPFSGHVSARDPLSMSTWGACVTGSAPRANTLADHSKNRKCHLGTVPLIQNLSKSFFKVKGRLNIADTPEGSYFYRSLAKTPRSLKSQARPWSFNFVFACCAQAVALWIVQGHVSSRQSLKAITIVVFVKGSLQSQKGLFDSWVARLRIRRTSPRADFSSLGVRMGVLKPSDQI